MLSFFVRTTNLILIAYSINLKLMRNPLTPKLTKLFQIRFNGDDVVEHKLENKLSLFLGEQRSSDFRKKNIENPLSHWIEESYDELCPTQESASKLKVLKVDICYQLINIIGEKATFCIEASDDSCGVNDSNTSLDFIVGSAEDLIGEVVTKIKKTYDVEEIHPEYVETSYNNYELYILELANGKEVHILSHHAQNGWYGGGSNSRLTYNDESPPIKSRLARCIFVVGLPASGKTSFVNANIDSNVCHICDDAIHWGVDYRIGLATLLEEGENVVFCDPNLCKLKAFEELFDFSMKYLMSVNQIAIVYYENDRNQCLLNQHRPNQYMDIDRFSNVYNETISFIESLDGVMIHKLPVFKS